MSQALARNQRSSKRCAGLVQQERFKAQLLDMVQRDHLRQMQEFARNNNTLLDLNANLKVQIEFLTARIKFLKKELNVGDTSLKALAQEIVQLQRDYARVQSDLAAAQAAAAAQKRSSIGVIQHWQQRALSAEAQLKQAADTRVQAAAALAVVAEAAEAAEAAEDSDRPRAQGQAFTIQIESDDSETDGSDDEHEDDDDDDDKMVFHEGTLATHVK